MKMRFLLIEDQSSSVELASRVLGDFASRIDHTPRGTLEEGMRMAREGHYDVILLDLRLDDSDREETMAAIPELKRAGQAPVVVMSGWPDPTIGRQCLRAGADAFVSKDELTTALLMAVQVALANAPNKERAPTFVEHAALLNRLLGIA